MIEPDSNRFFLAKLPLFIAASYQQLLVVQTPQERANRIVQVYDLGLRLATITLVSQYLVRDRDSVCNPYLNELLLEKFPHLTLDTWLQLFFASLRAYEGIEDILFVPELYSIYWDTSCIPHQPRAEVRRSFERLTQLAMDIRNERLRPRDEDGWERVATEMGSLLNQFLCSIEFLGGYDLIRVTNVDQLSYDFELHKGLNVTHGHQSLSEHMDLTPDRFYLRKGSDDFLLLHPFLVFWEGESETHKSRSTDIAVYDRYIYERLQYLLAALGKTIVKQAGVTEFVRLLYDTIEQYKKQRLQATRLSWWQLQSICADISRQRMATVRDKYRQDLYLDRFQARRAIDEFLASDKRSFVLIGKSGVGKSNFLLALSDELRARSNLCLFMYDGAQLKVEPSLTEAISEDFDCRLALPDRHIANIWREIAQIEGMEDKLVLLIVDGINENPCAKELLRQLDELVQGPWSWLKVIFSSRPETWQTIKQGVKLAEAFYYRGQQSQILDAGLEPFSYSVSIEPFSYQELPVAYANYQRVYDLQTQYDDLPGELRDLLREPLNLWLLARTYAGQEISEAAKIADIVDHYIAALLESGRLRKEDLRFLEKWLLPLMIHPGYYRNIITAANIDEAGSELYQAIYSEQLLSDGQRMDQSFRNLVDVDILTRQGRGHNQGIAFKYERFYEYFAGKALLAEVGANDSWKRHYQEWVDELPNAAFLWGAIKNCLEQQLQMLPAEVGSNLCIALAHLSDQHMLEILIAALTEFGKDEYDKTQQIIAGLLSQERRGLLSTLWSQARSAQCPASKRVGIEVASRLKMGKLLEIALTDSSPAVRAVALRHAFIYWRRNNEAGLELLERLVDQSVGVLGLPSSRKFESAIGFSLLVIFDDFKNTTTTDRLRCMWRRVIERVLRVAPGRLGSTRERIQGSIRSAVVKLVASFAIRMASETPSNSPMSIPDLKLFFRRDDDLTRRRNIVRKLVEYMDAERTDLRELRDVLLALSAERDMFIALIAIAMLEKHALAHPESTLVVVKDLFERALEVDPPGPFSIYVPPNALQVNVRQGDEAARKLHIDMVTRYLDRFDGKCWSKLHMRRYTTLDVLTFAENGNAEDSPLPSIPRHYVNSMIEQQDFAWMIDAIQWEVTQQAIQAGRPRLAFSVLEMLLGVQDKTVQNAIIELLARMRIYYPNQVDDFMEVNALDEAFTRAVRTRTPAETIGDIFEYRAFMFYETFALGTNTDFWQVLSWLLRRLPECASLEEWFIILFKTIVNIIYGERIFADVAMWHNDNKGGERDQTIFGTSE